MFEVLEVALRNGVDQRKLAKILKLQPGILDVEITDDERILLQFPHESPKELFDLRTTSLSEIIGSPPKFVPAESNRLRPDQWRLIGGGIALPIVAACHSGRNPWLVFNRFSNCRITWIDNRWFSDVQRSLC